MPSAAKYLEQREDDGAAVRGEPIVSIPEDTFRCFMGSEIESLVIDNCVLQKEQQNPALKLDYKHAFELD